MIAHQKSAFTMLEMAIVLTIIALIFASVLVGKELIRGAAVSRVVSELSEFRSAAQSFQLEYHGLPGDLENAYDYWGTNCASSQALCNGDGNGLLSSGYTESRMFWRHLWLANYLTQETTGLTGTTCTVDNEMRSDGGGGLYQAFSAPKTLYGNATYGLGFLYAGCDGSQELTGAVLTPEQAWMIDEKQDNGTPYSGNYIGIGAVNGGSTGAGCVTPTAQNFTTSNTPDYHLVNDSVVCRLVYVERALF